MNGEALQFPHISVHCIPPAGFQTSSSIGSDLEVLLLPRKVAGLDLQLGILCPQLGL